MKEKIDRQTIKAWGSVADSAGGRQKMQCNQSLRQ